LAKGGGVVWLEGRWVFKEKKFSAHRKEGKKKEEDYNHI